MEKPLHIPNNKKIKGLKIWCDKCRTNVLEICKENGKPLKQCRFGERHRFKIYISVPGSENGRKTKTLTTRDINEAIKEAVLFEQEVKAGNYQNEIKVEHKPETQKGNNKETPHLFVNAVAKYISTLHNENVPTHLRKEISTDHLKDIERKMERLAIALREKGYNLATFRMDQLNDATVGDVYDYLEKEKYSNRTFNRHFSYYTAFLKWFSEEYYPVKSWFKRYTPKPVNDNPQAISKEEFEGLLKIITAENGIQTYESGVKGERNFYRPYLIHAFQLGLHTGLRREGLIKMKFDDIVEYPDGSGYIKVENYKVNNIQKRKTAEDKKYVYVPLTKSLRKLLSGIEYEKFIGTENYVLAPEIESKRNKVMADLLSRAFAHYYKQLNTEKHLSFKSLRKTYITSLSLHMRSSARLLTDHTTDAVIERHYSDKAELARAVSKTFEVFPPEKERKNELEQVRNNENNLKERGIEK